MQKDSFSSIRSILDRLDPGFQTPDQLLSGLGVTKSKHYVNTPNQIPFNPKSSQKPMDIPVDEFISKEISVQFKKDNSFSFTVSDVIGAMSDSSKHGEIKGGDKPAPNSKERVEQVLRLVKDSKLRRSLFETMKESLQHPSNTSEKTLQESIMKNFETIAPVSEKDSFNLSEFKDLNSEIISIDKIIENSEKKHSGEEKAIFTNCRKMIYFVINRIQSALNEISKCFQAIYVIDKKYEGQIKDVKTLSKFVNGMIESGLPMKYVAFNTFLVCSTGLRGTDTYKPIWGQSRLVLFPSSMGGTVLKIAINTIGKRSNDAEYKYYQQVKGTEYGNYFAPVSSMTADRVILEMVRAKVDASDFKRIGTTEQEAVEILRNVASKANSRGLPKLIDIREDNVGVIGTQIVCIDYGAVP